MCQRKRTKFLNWNLQEVSSAIEQRMVPSHFTIYLSFSLISSHLLSRHQSYNSSSPASSLPCNLFTSHSLRSASDRPGLKFMHLSSVTPAAEERLSLSRRLRRLQRRVLAKASSAVNWVNSGNGNGRAASSRPSGALETVGPANELLVAEIGKDRDFARSSDTRRRGRVTASNGTEVLRALHGDACELPQHRWLPGDKAQMVRCAFLDVLRRNEFVTMRINGGGFLHVGLLSLLQK